MIALAVGLDTWSRLHDQPTVDHVHSAGEPELTAAVGHQFHGRGRVGRERPVQRKVRKHDPRCTLAALLAVEDDPERDVLFHADQVGRVASLDRHPYFLDTADQLGGPGLAGAEEVPGEQRRQDGGADDNEEIDLGHRLAPHHSLDGLIQLADLLGRVTGLNRLGHAVLCMVGKKL